MMFSPCALTPMVLGIHKGLSGYTGKLERGVRVMQAKPAITLLSLWKVVFFEIDVGGLSSTTFCIFQIHVWSKVSLNRTLVKVVPGEACVPQLPTRTGSGCQMTVEQDLEEGAWVFLLPVTSFCGVSVTSTWIPGGITSCVEGSAACCSSAS